MKRTVIAILGGLLSSSSCLSAEGYSFDIYLAERGGCEAQRQILDKRLREIRFDYVSPGNANHGKAIDLFGQTAAEWTEGDIQAVLAAFRRCEEQIFRRGLDRPIAQDRQAMIKEYEALLARGTRRIEETLREIIATDRSRTERNGGLSEGDGRSRGEDVAADRWNRDATKRSNVEQESGRLRGLGERAGETDPERVRRAEIQSELLEEARRVARDRERDRMRAEMPPGRRTTPPAPDGQPRPRTAEAFAPRPIVDRANCVVTREGFDQVQRGMMLDRVEAVIGCRGNLTATTNSADLGKIEVQVWEDRRANGTITVQFLNGLVYTKSQVGLTDRGLN